MTPVDRKIFLSPGEREVLEALETLTAKVSALHAAFDELTLVPPTEEDIRAAAPDPMEQHLAFVATAQRNYEARNGGHNGQD